MGRGSPKLRSDAGLTLVELMVAVAITAVVMTISVGIFVNQYKSYRSGHAVKSSQSDNQKAIDMVKDDLALAGWSVSPSLAFYIRDGGANAPDDIYVNDPSLIPVDLGNSTKTTRTTQRLVHMVDSDCAACGRYAGQTLQTTLDIDEDGQNDLKDLPVVIVWNDSTSQATVDSTNSAGNLATAASGRVWATPAIRYCVDNGDVANNCTPSGSSETLVLRKHSKHTGGRQAMAEDVVDLQVVYQDDGNNTYGNSGCSTCQMASFNASKIKWLDVSIVTRSRDRVRSMQDAGSCRPAVGNRQGASYGSDECGYEYRTYTTRITPFNRLQ